MPPVAEIICSLDLPHLRNGGEWKQQITIIGAPIPALKFSRARAIEYAAKLHKLGMSDADISGLISDLYWDSFVECLENRTFEKIPYKS